MPLALPSRRHTQVILGVAVLIAAVNLWIILHADLDWVWADGRARLTIARSIIDNKQPGFTQFGNTWLPLHPALMLPFIWIDRSEEHTSELQSLMRNSYAVFCLKKKKKNITTIRVIIADRNDKYNRNK